MRYFLSNSFYGRNFPYDADVQERCERCVTDIAGQRGYGTTKQISGVPSVREVRATWLH